MWSSCNWEDNDPPSAGLSLHLLQSEYMSCLELSIPLEMFVLLLMVENIRVSRKYVNIWCSEDWWWFQYNSPIKPRFRCSPLKMFVHKYFYTTLKSQWTSKANKYTFSINNCNEFMWKPWSRVIVFIHWNHKMNVSSVDHIHDNIFPCIYFSFLFFCF